MSKATTTRDDLISLAARGRSPLDPKLLSVSKDLMATFRRCEYFCHGLLARRIDDLTSNLTPENFEAVVRIVHGFRSAFAPTTPSRQVQVNGGSLNQMAERFERYVAAAAADAKPGQKKAINAWLNSPNGEIELKKLWHAAGVANQHDYAGIGSSLTRNMKKAGGSKDWYQWFQNDKGNWIYKVIPELLEPLRQAFGIKAD